MKSTFYDGKMYMVYWLVFCEFVKMCCARSDVDTSDYSGVYRWDQFDCDYEIYDITQYEKRLIIWDGNAFDIWCSLGFQGKNSDNVATSYKVCFKLLDYKLGDCKVEMKYESHSNPSLDRSFSCNDNIPEVWCGEGITSLQIDSNKNKRVNDDRTEVLPNTYIRLEIYAEAAVSMSLATCFGIIGGVVAVIIIVGIIIIWRCRRGKSTEGRVISTQPNSSQPNSSQPNASGQVLMGYPTSMEVMQPCGKGRYRPQNVMVQQSVQMPPSGVAQPNQVVFQGGQTAAYTPSAPLMSDVYT